MTTQPILLLVTTNVRVCEEDLLLIHIFTLLTWTQWETSKTAWNQRFCQWALTSCFDFEKRLSKSTTQTGYYTHGQSSLWAGEPGILVRFTKFNNWLTFPHSSPIVKTTVCTPKLSALDPLSFQSQITHFCLHLADQTTVSSHFHSIFFAPS